MKGILAGQISGAREKGMLWPAEGRRKHASLCVYQTRFWEVGGG